MCLSLHMLDFCLFVNLKKIENSLSKSTTVRQPLVNSTAFLPAYSVFISELLYYLHVKVSLSLGTN